MKTALLLLAGCLVSFADGPTGQPDISGTWRPQSPGNESGSTFVIEQRADEVRIREVDTSGKTRTDIQCATLGGDCPIKLDGDAAKASYYFNGRTLVELVWMGTQVTETKRTLSADRTKLMVQVMRMTPPGDPKRLVFVRVTEVAKR